MTKRVTFSDDTKSFDGCSIENASFHYLLKQFLWGKHKFSFFDILRLVKDNLELLEYFIIETNNIIYDLENLDSTQIYDLLFEEDESNVSTNEIDSFWDHPHFAKIANENKKKFVPIARYGSRDTNEHLSPEHKIFLMNFYNLLLETKNFIKNKK